jgi:hypothetical protein
MGMADKANVLVIGAPRSGTTLLAGLLSAGKDASPMLPECTHITQVIQQCHNILHYSDPPRFAAYAINETVLVGMYRGMVNAMLDTVRSQIKDIAYRYLILKDPELSQLIDWIPTFFGEESKTICVVRDPRAVIASMLTIERRRRRDLWCAWRKTPNHFLAHDLVNQVFRERRLISDFFMYYWKVQDSRLRKSGAAHVVSFERIMARDEDEFKRLEVYLGFAVGREGFGKIHFDFDRADPTFSDGYGRQIQETATDFKTVLTYLQIRKIKTAYSGLNEVYGWW